MTESRRHRPVDVRQTQAPQTARRPIGRASALAYHDREVENKAEREEQKKKWDEERKEREEAKNKLYPVEPPRFSLRVQGKPTSYVNSKGECISTPSEAVFVILDTDPDNLTGFHSEHEIKKQGKKKDGGTFEITTFEQCLADTVENCPLCANVKQPEQREGISRGDFKFFMTIITDGYTFFDTKEKRDAYVPIQKHMMPLKLGDRENYLNILQRKGTKLEDDVLSWRGITIYASRGTDTKSSKIGVPQVDGVMKEDELKAWVVDRVKEAEDNGHVFAFTDDKGNEVDPVEYFLTPFIYRNAPKSADELRKEYCIAPQAGSRQEYTSSFANAGGGRATRQAMSTTRTRTPQQENPLDNLEDDEVPY